MNRTTLYWVANGCFTLCIAVGALYGSASSAHPLYLWLLFALCSSPILHITRLNDRYAVLALFSAVYFLFFGVLDVSNLFLGQPGQVASTDELMDPTELLILVGGLLAHLGYLIACRSMKGTETRRRRDWPERTLVVMGAALWVVSTWVVWKYKVFVIADSTSLSVARGLASLSGLSKVAIMLATYIQPFSILILAYAQSKYRRAYMMPVVMAVLSFQFVIGFVDDSKGEAMTGAVIVVVTKLLVDGKLPKAWLVAAVVFTAVAFPLLQANRAVRHEYGITHEAAVQDLGKAFSEALNAKARTTTGRDRAETFFERMSLKREVETIVSKSGHSVAFQNGHTLTPLLTVFIPRLFWPDKPDIQVGKVVNKEFNFSDSEDVYISPTHLGELYWNFGWGGTLVGMLLIGSLLGVIGSRSSLAESVTLTRTLVVGVTVQLIVLGFESSIAAEYSVWLRMMLAIGIMHLVFARMPVSRGQVVPGSVATPVSSQLGQASTKLAGPLFPNLSR